MKRIDTLPPTRIFRLYDGVDPGTTVIGLCRNATADPTVLPVLGSLLVGMGYKPRVLEQPTEATTSDADSSLPEGGVSTAYIEASPPLPSDPDHEHIQALAALLLRNITSGEGQAAFVDNRDNILPLDVGSNRNLITIS